MGYATTRMPDDMRRLAWPAFRRFGADPGRQEAVGPVITDKPKHDQLVIQLTLDPGNQNLIRQIKALMQ